LPGGANISIVLVFAVSMIDFEATGIPHFSQNRASSAIVDPQLAQKPISTSHLMSRENTWNTVAGAVLRGGNHVADPLKPLYADEF
jgi:hypothetical protein